MNPRLVLRVAAVLLLIIAAFMLVPMGIAIFSDTRTEVIAFAGDSVSR